LKGNIINNQKIAKIKDIIFNLFNFSPKNKNQEVYIVNSIVTKNIKLQVHTSKYLYAKYNGA
jgi:hypothetical protein